MLLKIDRSGRQWRKINSLNHSPGPGVRDGQEGWKRGTIPPNPTFLFVVLQGFCSTSSGHWRISWVPGPRPIFNCSLCSFNFPSYLPPMVDENSLVSICLFQLIFKQKEKASCTLVDIDFLKRFTNIYNMYLIVGCLHLKGNLGWYNPTAGDTATPLYIFGCNPIFTSRFALVPKAG